MSTQDKNLLSLLDRLKTLKEVYDRIISHQEMLISFQKIYDEQPKNGESPAKFKEPKEPIKKALQKYMEAQIEDARQHAKNWHYELMYSIEFKIPSKEQLGEWWRKKYTESLEAEWKRYVKESEQKTQ